MAKKFEDRFSELQSDMVSICLEYVDNKADGIYIYCSCEENALYFNYFYNVNGITVHKHKLNDVASGYDTSIDVQRQVMKIGKDDLMAIYMLFKEAGREMPTEMKLVYDVKDNKLQADYNYEPVVANSKEMTQSNAFENWYQSIH